ncbi:MFS transporter [Bacillus sp. UNCCL13]|uniref:MFS transporter n=1 Tax=Bacillus sp. UNCCL13 TaxID=1502772 RepID=UPI0020C83CFD|nr:MFS transporter [Bacillus sp. UNCCL13]
MKEDEHVKSESHINRLNEKYSIRNGIASTVVMNISNNYFALFAIGVLGASNYQVGLISSLPQFIGMFAMILCSIIIEKYEDKKQFTAYSIFFTRFFLFLMAFVMLVPTDYRAWTFVILVGLMNFPGSFANLSWQSFIGDLIPDERRSGFFSERNRILTMVGMAVTFLIGILLQMFAKSNPIPYQLLFSVAFIFGIVEVYFLTKHVSSKKTQPSKKTIEFKLDVTIFKDKPFIFFVICGLFFNFGWQMAWSLFSIYQIKYAMATGLWISLFTVANQVAQIASFKWWGKMADKHSNAKMMILVSLGMATAPIMTIMSTNLIYLIFVNAFSGLFVSGTVLILFNQLLEVTNENNRSTYIAKYNIVLAIIGFIAPQFGVYLLEVTSMEVAMTTSTILRASSAIFFVFLYVYLKKRNEEMKIVIS